MEHLQKAYTVSISYNRMAKANNTMMVEGIDATIEQLCSTHRELV